MYICIYNTHIYKLQNTLIYYIFKSNQNEVEISSEWLSDLPKATFFLLALSSDIPAKAQGSKNRC